LNHEIALLNKILETGDLKTCFDSDVGFIFKEYGDVWNYIVQFNEDYGTMPGRDAIKEKFKTFEFLKTDSPLDYYIDDARKKNIGALVRSTLFDASQKLKEGIDPSDVLQHISAKSIDIMRTTGTFNDTNIVDWQDRALVLRDRIENPNSSSLGIPTGIEIIDENFGGWQGGDFIVVIGWTGANKSFFTRLLAVEAWKQGYSPLVISLEMDKIQEQYRIDTLLNEGKVFLNSQLMHGRDVDPDDYEQWAEDEFDGKHPFHLVTSEGIEQADQYFVQAKIQQYKPDLVILDYHTLFEDGKNGGTETERAKNLSKDFKRIALRNSIPIIDVAGVTMSEGHGERPPELQEIAWSKQLSYDADLVLAVHRDAESEYFQAISRKVRRGRDFAFYLKWNLDTGSWEPHFDVME
jgi:replicative DNA helicase